MVPKKKGRVRTTRIGWQNVSTRKGEENSNGEK